MHWQNNRRPLKKKNQSKYKEKEERKLRENLLWWLCRWVWLMGREKDEDTKEKEEEEESLEREHWRASGSRRRWERLSKTQPSSRIPWRKRIAVSLGGSDPFPLQPLLLLLYFWPLPLLLLQTQRGRLDANCWCGGQVNVTSKIEWRRCQGCTDIRIQSKIHPNEFEWLILI